MDNSKFVTSHAAREYATYLKTRGYSVVITRLPRTREGFRYEVIASKSSGRNPRPKRTTHRRLRRHRRDCLCIICTQARHKRALRGLPKGRIFAKHELLAPNNPAAKQYRRFHRIGPRRVSKVWLAHPRRVMRIGRITRVSYVPDARSGKQDKKGSLINYYHDFGPGVSGFVSEDGKQLIITGGKFRVTDWLRG